ncbi:MAG TPA: zf-HC2 domain-containing protein, partial [Thermomicrobiales bacterium]|nr:zf-HC2 domain-containing protein [Thermomicrobiales bacterium]
MDCREIRPLLSAYMDNELAPDDLRAVQEHVADCADCAALLTSYRRIRAAVRALPEADPPPELREAVFAKATPAYRRRAALLGLGQQGLAAAALVVTILAVFFTASIVANRGGARVGNPNGDPTTPPRIVSVEPASGDPATAWPPTRPVRVTFSKPMDEAVTSGAVLPARCPNSPAGAALPPRPELAWQGTTLLISGLRADTDYCIQIDPAKARDRYNHPLQDSPLTLITFRTAQILTAQREPTATTATATPPPPT